MLRFVMPWGLHHSAGWTIDRSPVVAVPPVPVLLAPELLQQVQETAAAYWVSMAAWLREAIRWVATGDVPASWRAGETASRSHASGYYFRKYQLGLDPVTSQQLEALTHTLGRPAAGVIRQLILQAKLENFPTSWQMAVAEQRNNQGEELGHPPAA